MIAPQRRRNDGKILIHTATIKLRNGRVLVAAHYGKKSFAIWVDPNRLKPDTVDSPANELK